MNRRPLRVGLMKELELEPPNQFPDSATHRDTGNLLWRISANGVVTRLSEAGVVDDVCSLSADLEFHASIRNNSKALSKREVDIAQARSINLVSAEGAKLVGVIGRILPGL